MDSVKLNSSLGLVAAIVYHFQVEGVHIHISSQFPVKSGLGGSGITAVLLVTAISDLLGKFGHRKLSNVETVCLSQMLEDATGVSQSGLQDQVAALYGGANLWEWNYRNLAKPYHRVVLFDNNTFHELEGRILIAYTGRTHKPSGLSQEWINDFIMGRSRNAWEKVILATRNFASALIECKWDVAASYLNEECQIRAGIWPEILDDNGKKLVAAAIGNGCGARFCGGGGGGGIWAIGERDKIAVLNGIWRDLLSNSDGGYLLEAEASNTGLEVLYE